LSANWKPDPEDKTNRANADLVVHATEKLVKSCAQASTETTRVLGWSMLGMALLLVLWVAVYLNGAAVAPLPEPTAPAAAPSSFRPVAFFLLLYISAAVGTGLRVLVAYQSNQITRLTFFAVGLELVIATNVAFGLALFYLIGGISFTGEVVALAPNNTTFATIAVSMSLLGLAAGYLVPLDKLRDRLQKIFAQERK